MQILLRDTAPHPHVTLGCDTKNRKCFQNMEPFLKEGTEPVSQETDRTGQAEGGSWGRALLWPHEGCFPVGDGTKGQEDWGQGGRLQPSEVGLEPGS